MKHRGFALAVVSIAWAASGAAAASDAATSLGEAYDQGAPVPTDSRGGEYGVGLALVYGPIGSGVNPGGTVQLFAAYEDEVWGWLTWRLEPGLSMSRGSSTGTASPGWFESSSRDYEQALWMWGAVGRAQVGVRSDAMFFRVGPTLGIYLQQVESDLCDSTTRFEGTVGATADWGTRIGPVDVALRMDALPLSPPYCLMANPEPGWQSREGIYELYVPRVGTNWIGLAFFGGAMLSYAF